MNRSPAEALTSRDNCFDIARLLSCLGVVFSHSFALAGSTDPVHSVLGFQLGSIAVFVLFGMSGYLLAASLQSDGRLGAFWIKRWLRLWPGLVVCALLTAFVLGPIVSSLSPGTYFARAATYTYVLKQSVFDTFGPHLPGVFLHNPLAVVVNGSLWTLPLEVCCYLALAVAAVIGALRKPWWFAAVVVIVCVVVVVIAPPDSPRGVAPTGTKLIGNALRPCGVFAFGSLLWLARDRVPRTWPLLALAVAVLFVPVGIGVRSAIDLLAVPYVVVVLGSMRPGRLRVLTAGGDVSYGAYIYGFPIQQLLAQYIAGISPGAMLALSIPLTWLAGLLSWHGIERRALSLRRRLVAPRAGGQRPAPPEPEGYAAVSR